MTTMITASGDVNSDGRLFHVLAAAVQNARLPMVHTCVDSQSLSIIMRRAETLHQLLFEADS